MTAQELATHASALDVIAAQLRETVGNPASAAGEAGVILSRQWAARVVTMLTNTAGELRELIPPAFVRLEGDGPMSGVKEYAP